MAVTSASQTSVLQSGSLIEDVSPGEVILKKLFAQFVASSDTKLKFIATQKQSYQLAKSLQRGEDPQFDQLLLSLKEVAKFCLRSLLKTIFDWRRIQMKNVHSVTNWGVPVTGEQADSPQQLSKREQEHFIERQQLAIEFIFCLVITEILQELPVHPVPESFIHDIEQLAFQHFRAQEPLRERSTNNPNVANAKKVADLYAEVIGVLSQERFTSVRRRFFSELRSTHNSLSVIISVIEGLSFVRVIMYPTEELEGWFGFLQECANYMLESQRGEKLRHAMCGLLVEILSPVSAVIKYEASIPAVRKLVQTLYPHSFEHSKRQRHSLAYIPLVTVLLGISDDTFFLNNWHMFVKDIVLPNIKRNDSKLQKVALDSLYRLLWVYMIRIKGEGNVTTFTRLRPVVDTLFPRSGGGRGLQPKDLPPNVFVKIIHFIAWERLDYAMTEILQELVGRIRGTVHPERLVVALRAFLMIVDSLEKNEGDPPMPAPSGSVPSGSITRARTKFHSHTLTGDMAKKLNVSVYYPLIQQALGVMLRQLDVSIGRPLVSTIPHVARQPEEFLSGERKPKVGLLKTCLAALPRLMPSDISHDELIEILSRLTIHVDSEVPRMAFIALQSIITSFSDWRGRVVMGFAMFILRDIPDNCPLVLENALKTLAQFLSHWCGLLNNREMSEEAKGVENLKGAEGAKKDGKEQKEEIVLLQQSLAWVEACALVTFCSYRSVTRKYSLSIMKEVRSLLENLRMTKDGSETVMDVLERATPDIIKRYLATLTPKERVDLRQHNLNLNWLSDRPACFLEHGGNRDSLRDAWSQCLVGLLKPGLISSSTLSIRLTWPFILQRMTKAYSVLDPGLIIPERTERPLQLRHPRSSIVSQPEMFLWRNYLLFACCTAPPSSYPSLSIPFLSDAGLLLGDRLQRQYTAKDLFQMVAPLVRSEGEVGEVVVTALGLVNPDAFYDLLKVLHSVMHESKELKRSEQTKKRKRREIQRLHLTRVLSLAAEHGCCTLCSNVVTMEGELVPLVMDFIQGIQPMIEGGISHSTELQMHYASFISNIIKGFPDDRRYKLFSCAKRKSLFFALSKWNGSFWQEDGHEQRMIGKHPRINQLVLHAMSALLCCGPVFNIEILDSSHYLYCWLENMVSVSEEKIQSLGRWTVQMLLEYNREPTFLQWVIDQCYSTKQSCARFCFHAFSNVFAKIPSYSCDLTVLLHLLLFNTNSTDTKTKERALHLLHILDRRLFGDGDSQSSRPELLVRVVGSSYCDTHLAISEELAATNPELTLPLLSEMVKRFEVVGNQGRRSILQLMLPWLRNVELVEDNLRHHVVSCFEETAAVSSSSPCNPLLKGTGWGSLEGSQLVLHNLVYLTAKHGDDYMKEIENLWTALCTWPSNIRVAINYLARLTCVTGNLSLMLQQAKRICLFFCHSHYKIVVQELIKELQCMDHITVDLQALESPPFFRFIGRYTDTQTGDFAMDASLNGDGWAVNWRLNVCHSDGLPVPLPYPQHKLFFASMKDMLKVPVRQMVNLHRSNFALFLLSEMVIDIGDVEWAVHLPLLLHVITLGLDVHKPLIYEHSRKLLGNLVVLLACRDDATAACEARLTQHKISLSSPSLLSLSNDVDAHSCSSLGVMGSRDTVLLAQKAKQLISFIAVREAHKAPWPFVDHSSNRLSPCNKVTELTQLVEAIVSVFQDCVPTSLSEKWARIALQWATNCPLQQLASQSFQICRALHLPLSNSMLRDALTRVAEYASDQTEELQNYVMEIVLTLESAIDNTDSVGLFPPPSSSATVPATQHSRQASDIGPLPGEIVTFESTKRPPSGTQIEAEETCSTSRRKFPHKRSHSRGHSVTNVELPVMLKVPNDTSGLQSSLAADESSTTTSAGFADLTCLNKVSDDVVVSRVTDIQRPLSAGNKLKYSTSVDTTVTNLSSSSLSKVGVVQPRITLSAKDPLPRKSAPPVSLMKVFEPPLSIQSQISPEASTHTSLPTSSIGLASPHIQSKGDVVESTEEKAEEDNIEEHKNNEIEADVFTTDENIYEDGFRNTSSRDEETPGVTISEDDRILPTQRSTEEPDMHLEQQQTKEEDQQGRYQEQLQLESQQQQQTTDEQQQYQDSFEHDDSSLDFSTIEQNSQLPVFVSNPLQLSPITGLQEEARQRTASSPLPINLVSSQPDLSAGGMRPIERAPSHPDFPVSMSLSGTDCSGSIVRARSVTQLQSRVDEKINKQHNFSGICRTFTPVDVATSNHREDQSNQPPIDAVDFLRQKASSAAPPRAHLSLSHQNSPFKHSEKDILRRRVSADPEKSITSLTNLRAKGRPMSMFETSSYQYHQSLETVQTDYVTQLFWTSASLLESDYEGEFSLAVRLFQKVLLHMDLFADSTYCRLEALLHKMKWENFPGVLKLLLKGLTLESTTDCTRDLLAVLSPHSTRAVFDPTQHTGLPVNIVALLPELVLNFDEPTELCKKAASSIATACEKIPCDHDTETKGLLKDMGHIFMLYSDHKFNNSRSIWLKSVCHYISKGYHDAASEIFNVLAMMLERGRNRLHQPVLWIVHELMIKLEENGQVNVAHVTLDIINAISKHLKSHLWQDALSVLTLAVKNSSTLVQPPTPHLPMVDLGFFHQSLPGPTLKFSMDLSSSSADLHLAQNSEVFPDKWRSPQGCQYTTRRLLRSVINACGPIPVLFSSPSVIFTEEPPLIADDLSIYSTPSEEQNSLPSVHASSEVLDTSQQESVNCIIGNEFDFLNKYPFEDEEADEEEEEEEEEEDDDEEGIHEELYNRQERLYSSSLSSSHSSLASEVDDQLGLSGEGLGTAQHDSFSVPLDPQSSAHSQMQLKVLSRSPSQENEFSNSSFERSISPQGPLETSSPSLFQEINTEHTGQLKSRSTGEEEATLDNSLCIIEEEEVEHKEAEGVLEVKVDAIDKSTGSEDNHVIAQDDEVASNDVGDEAGVVGLSQNVELLDKYTTDKAEEERPHVTAYEKDETVEAGERQEETLDIQLTSDEVLLVSDDSSLSQRKETPAQNETWPLQLVDKTLQLENNSLSQDESSLSHDHESSSPDETPSQNSCSVTNVIETNEEKIKKDQDEERNKEGDECANEIKEDQLTPLPEIVEQVKSNMSEIDVTVSSDDMEVAEYSVSRFLFVPSSKALSVWQDHVAALNHLKSPVIAVDTFFLFGRVFSYMLQDVCLITRDVCGRYSMIQHSLASHLLVTVDQLSSRLQLPHVFLSSEFVRAAGLMGQYISIVSEMGSHVESYINCRSLIVEYSTQEPTSPSHGDSSGELMMSTEMDLLNSIYKLHVCFLLLTGLFFKLLRIHVCSHSLVETEYISDWLNDFVSSIHKAVENASQESQTREQSNEISGVSKEDAAMAISDALRNGGPDSALTLIHLLRERFHDEDLLGGSKDDDLSVVLFSHAYSVWGSCRRVFGVTESWTHLLEIQCRVSKENISLSALVQSPLSPELSNMVEHLRAVTATLEHTSV